MYRSTVSTPLAGITVKTPSSPSGFPTPKLRILPENADDVLKTLGGSMLHLGKKRKRCSGDLLNPNKSNGGNGRSQKGKRRDPASRSERQFVCPLFRINSQKYGGLGGCAAWATPEIHRLYSDHLKRHMERGHITEEVWKKVKYEKPRGKKLTVTEKQDNDKRRWLDTWRTLRSTKSGVITEDDQYDLPCPYYEEKQTLTFEMRSNAADAPIAKKYHGYSRDFEDLMSSKQKRTLSRSEEILSSSESGPPSPQPMPSSRRVTFPWPPLPHHLSTVMGLTTYYTLASWLAASGFDVLEERHVRCAGGLCYESHGWFTDNGIKDHIHMFCPTGILSSPLPRFYCPLVPCNFSYDSVLFLEELEELGAGWVYYDATSFYAAPVIDRYDGKRLFCGFKDVFDLQIHMAFGHVLGDVASYENVSPERSPGLCCVKLREKIWFDRIFEEINRENVGLVGLIQFFTNPKAVCKCTMHTNDCLRHATNGGLSCNGCGFINEAVLEGWEGIPDWLEENSPVDEMVDLIKGVALANTEAYYSLHGEGGRAAKNTVEDVPQ